MVHELTQPTWNNAEARKSIESDMNHLAQAQMCSRILANIFLKVCMHRTLVPVWSQQVKHRSCDD